MLSKSALLVLVVALLIAIAGFTTANYYLIVFMKRLFMTGIKPELAAVTVHELNKVLPKGDNYRYVVLACSGSCDMLMPVPRAIG